jgi:hypothetical protein
VSSPVALPPVTLSQLFAAAAGSEPAAAPSATIDGSVEALRALAALGASAILSGTVAATPGASDPALQLLTALGTFSIKTELPLPPGTQLTIQLGPEGPGSVTIIAVDGLATTSVATAPTLAPTAPPPVSVEPPLILLDFGTVVTATVIAPPSPPATELEAPSHLDAFAPALLLRTNATVLAPLPSDPTLPSVARAAPISASTAVPPQNVFSPGILAAQDILPATGGNVTGSNPRPDAIPSQAGDSALGPRPSSSLPAGSSAALAGSPTTPAPIRTPPPGTEFPLRIVAAQLTAAPSETPATSSVSPAVVGTLRAFGPAAALLDTAAGVLQIEPAPKLAAGASVGLRLLPGAPPSATLVQKANGSVVEIAADPSPTIVSAPSPANLVEIRDGVEPPGPPISAPAAGVGAPSRTAPPPTDTAAASPPPAVFRIVLPAATTPPQAGGTTVSQAIIGRVLAEASASTPQSTLVETVLGTLSLVPRLALPPGSLLLLDAQGAFDDLTPVTAGRATTASDWPALQATLSAIGHTAPELAAQLRSDLSATAGEKLAATFLLIVASLRGGSAVPWPGAAIEHALALAGRDDVKQRLAGDLGALREIAADSATQPWQVFILPILDGETIRPVRLYLRREEKSDDGRQRTNEKSARFVLEFELSRLGALQIDGFIRHRRFDLVLRSHAPLAPALRTEVSRIFHDRIAAAELSGEIDFATVSRFSIAPLDALRDRIGFAV